MAENIGNATGTGSRAISRAADIGIVGLGVMGRNLALNFASRGHRVAIYDAWLEVRQAYREEAVGAPDGVTLYDGLADFVAALARPRAVLLLVKAGEAVDRQIADLAPLLEAGDHVIDAGNAHYRDSERRAEQLAARSIEFLGLGVSGGAKGARIGASLMAGGTPAAYGRVERLLSDVAARVDGEPCCAHLGGPGAGHFVKTLHNGIEYAVMQLIAEVYWVMRHALSLETGEIAEYFAAWNRGDLAGYLVEITAQVLAERDAATGASLVDVILDKAEEKGTGRWAAAAALELGVPVPTLMEAVAARALSMQKDERLIAEQRLAGPAHESPEDKTAGLVEAFEQALLASVICAYAQGFAVIATAAREQGWQLDLGRVARIWRGGSILRAALLEPIAAAHGRDPALANLMVAPELGTMLARCQDGWRRAVAFAVTRGLPVPALASALAYYDAYRSGRLWANLIQGQRDFFGAHGFERTDRPGVFHGNWPPPREGVGEP